MPTPTATELDLLRADWDAGLTDSATIQRQNANRTPGGGTQQVYVTLESGVAAKLLPIASHSERQERDQAGRLSSVQLWAVNFHWGQDVTSRDRILFGSRQFEVIGVQSWLSNEVGRVAICAEVL